MPKTCEEFFVSHRKTHEVKIQVESWMKNEGITIKVNHENYVYGVLEMSGATNHFLLSVMSTPQGTSVKCEGWTSIAGAEHDFSNNANLGRVPRHKGIESIERLSVQLETTPTSIQKKSSEITNEAEVTKTPENQEIIVDCIENISHAGNTITLFFTSDRCIVAKTLGSGARTGSYLLGGAVGLALVAKRAQEKASELNTLPPEVILSMDGKNFDISYDEINAVKIKKPGTFRAGYLKIVSEKKEHKFTILKGQSNFSFISNLPLKIQKKIIMEN